MFCSVRHWEPLIKAEARTSLKELGNTTKEGSEWGCWRLREKCGRFKVTQTYIQCQEEDGREEGVKDKDRNTPRCCPLRIKHSHFNDWEAPQSACLLPHAWPGEFWWTLLTQLPKASVQAPIQGRAVDKLQQKLKPAAYWQTGHILEMWKDKGASTA